MPAEAPTSEDQVSSQDFPGPYWQNMDASDDWRSGYRPVSGEGHGHLDPAGRPGSNQHGYDVPQPNYGGAPPERAYLVGHVRGGAAAGEGHSGRGRRRR